MCTGLVLNYMNFLPAVNVIYLNANIEIIMGTLILVGLFTRVIAAIFTIHLIPIILALGINSLQE